MFQVLTLIPRENHVQHAHRFQKHMCLFYAEKQFEKLLEFHVHYPVVCIFISSEPQPEFSIFVHAL